MDTVSFIGFPSQPALISETAANSNTLNPTSKSQPEQPPAMLPKSKRAANHLSVFHVVWARQLITVSDCGCVIRAASASRLHPVINVMLD